MNVSRHHCAFAIDPPAVWVRDLHSHNGTYLNGKNIAEVPQIHANDNDEPIELPAYELNAGDEVRVGDTVFRVEVDEQADNTDVGVVPLYFL
jgi:pSer/pThr/pTyr-binding forkhead associated (FHA) protein